MLNRILDDYARRELSWTVDRLAALCPEMTARKMPRSTVQQAWVFHTVETLFWERPAEALILAVGAYEDTACEALKKCGFRVAGIDSVWRTPLAVHHAERKGRPLYDCVYACSVIEHVQDDETFLRQMIDLTRPGGYVLLTMDYRATWKAGDPKPKENVRFYSRSDLDRLAGDVRADVSLFGGVDWLHGEMDFQYDGCRYAFATMVLRKEGFSGR